MKESLLKASFIGLLFFVHLGLFAQTFDIDTVLYEDVSCYNANDGMITIVPDTDAISFEYSIDNAETFVADSIFEDLAAGTYNVAIRDANDTVYYDMAIVIAQPENVEIDLGNDLAVCEGYVISVADTFDTYTWSTGNTTNTQLITETGSYYLAVTDGPGTCGFDIINVAVYDYPEDPVPETAPYCEGGSLQLTATGGTHYLWSTGETTSTITVAPEEDTYYTVTVTNTICYTVDTVMAEMHEFYNEIVSDTEVCTGSELDVVVNSYYDDQMVSNGVSVLWSFGSTNDTASVTVSEAGMITVMTSYVDGCMDIDTIEVETLEAPMLTVVETQTICSGGTATLIATGGDTYSWSNGETNDTITITPTTDTTLTVVAALENGCTDTGTSTVLIGTVNVADAGVDKMICEGSATCLNAYGGDSYTWVFDGDTIAETQCVQIQPVNDGNYIVHVESGACTDSDTVFVGIYDLPVVDLGATDVSICEGSLAWLQPDDTSIDYTYEWSTGETTSWILVGETSTVSLTVTDGNGCVGTSDEVNVTLIEVPVLTLTGNDVLCQGQSSELTVTGAENYVWNTGSTESVITVMPTDTTTYSVIGYINGCYSEAELEIIYIDNPAPEVSFEDNIEFCGPSYLEVGSGYSSYLWSTGETNTNQILVDTTNTYAVTITNSDGCFASNETFVEVFEVPEVDLGDDVYIDYEGLIILSVNNGYDVLWSWGNQTATTDILVIEGDDPGFVDGVLVVSVVVTSSDGCENSDEIVLTSTSSSQLDVKKIINVYPNPSDGHIFVNIEDVDDQFTCRLIDALGNIVMEREIESNIEELDLSGLENGMYFVQFEGKKYNSVQKITIY